MPATGIDALRIRANTLGNTMICFDSENELTLLAAGEPHLLPQKIECVDDTLSVKAMNIGACFAKGQKKKILAEVHVPLRTKIAASFTAGVLILNGGEADLQIKGLVGEVAGWTHARHVRIQLCKGDVSINELRGEANCPLCPKGSDDVQ